MQQSKKNHILGALLCGMLLYAVTAPSVSAQALSDEEFEDFFGSAPQASTSTTSTSSGTATAAATTTTQDDLTLPEELPVTGSFDVVFITTLGFLFVTAGVFTAQTLFRSYE